MATPVTLGSAKTPWIVPLYSNHAALTVATSLDAVGAHSAFLSAIPVEDQTAGRFILTIPTGASALTIPPAAGDDQVTSVMEFGFFGEGAAGTILDAELWRISKASEDVVATTGAWGGYMGKLEIILGAKTYSGTGGQPPFDVSGKTYRFADTINIVDDFSPTPPGFRHAGAAPGAWATLLADTLGAKAFVISLVKRTATSAGLAYRVL